METLKVVVLGASGIGKFHVREFSNAGCEVVAILGSSEESSEKTAEELLERFGVKVRPYHDLEELIESENLDAASVPTPPKFHEKHIRTCLESGLHVLSEKPFVWSSETNNYKIAKDLVELSEEKNKILTVNTQWVSALPKISEYISLDDVQNFYARMDPYLKGVEMLADHLPHTNSLIIRLVPNGEARNIKFPIKRDGEIKIEFDFVNKEKTCKTAFYFKYKAERPRPVIFSINNKKFSRKIQTDGGDYKHFFAHGDQRFRIEDPFKISVSQFVNSIRGKGEPLISKEELLENIKLQDLIIEKYIRDK